MSRKLLFSVLIINCITAILIILGFWGEQITNLINLFLKAINKSLLIKIFLGAIFLSIFVTLLSKKSTGGLESLINKYTTHIVMGMVILYLFLGLLDLAYSSSIYIDVIKESHSPTTADEFFYFINKSTNYLVVMAAFLGLYKLVRDEKYDRQRHEKDRSEKNIKETDAYSRSNVDSVK